MIFMEPKNEYRSETFYLVIDGEYVPFDANKIPIMTYSEKDLFVSMLYNLRKNNIFIYNASLKRKTFKKYLMSKGFPPRRAERVCQIIGSKHGKWRYNLVYLEYAIQEMKDWEW